MTNIHGADDSTLCSLSSCGNREAEELLINRYSVLVRICARPYFLAGGDGEDLIQEGLLGLLSAIRQYDENKNASFKTFAELCIRNRLYSAVTSASRMKHQPLNNSVSYEERMEKEPASVLTNPEELVIARERTDEFYRKISEYLSGFEASVVMLYADGLSYAEIADELGKSVKSIDNAISRVKRKLGQHNDLSDFSLS